jgi:hypothetical protein
MAVLAGVVQEAVAQSNADKGASLKLSPGVKIVIDDDEPDQIRRAVADLERDLEKVLGEASPEVVKLDVVHDEPALIIAGPEADWPGLELSDRIKGWEAHGVYVRRVEGQPHVILHGSDLRGTIYAIYSFTERFLGVKPLWYWAMQEPEQKESVKVPLDFEQIFEPPQVKWRAWFLNDDHRLRNWYRQSPERLEAIGELMLRLKVNTLENYQIGPLGGPIRRYDLTPAVAMADRYGLVVSSTHISPFGAVYGNNLSDWKKYWRNIRDAEPPEISMDNIDPMKDFWRYHIETILFHGLEAVWTIAFRGHTDAPFWKTVQDVPESREERMEITEQMWGEQIELLRQETEEENPPMRIIFYHELSENLADGELEPPREPSLIWNFVAARRDHFPAEDIRSMDIPDDQLVGYYMNLQFTSTGSHYVQAESPWKMERNFRMVEKLSPTGITFAVVNAGNVREHLMELAAYSTMMWDFDAYDSDEFLEEFCTTYFGEQYAQRAAELYRRFYDAYWQQREPDLEGFPRQYIFHDYRLTRSMILLTRRLQSNPDRGKDLNPFWSGDWFRISPEDNNANSELEAAENGLTRSVQQLRQITADTDKLYKQLPQKYRPFFNINLRAQAHYLMYASDTVRHLAEALLARTYEKVEEAQKSLNEAKQAAAQMVSALEKTQYGAFNQWYEVRGALGPHRRSKGVLQTKLNTSGIEEKKNESTAQGG